MSLGSRCAWLARGMFRRGWLERDMDAEMRFHIAAYIEDQVRAGLSKREAGRRARLEFGVVENWKEQCREARGLRLFDELRQDFRYAARMLRKTPAFTFFAAATLALGIGANASIFSVVRTFVLRPLPYPSGERLVTVCSRETKRGWRYNLTPGDLYDFREPDTAIDGIAGWAHASFTLGGRGAPERVEGGRVNADFFRVLGVAPALGRDFTAQDDVAGSAAVVLIGDGLWKSHFGSDENVAGRVIELDGERARIIGVMPRNFQFAMMGKADLWKPLALNPSARQSRNSASLRAIARLKSGVTVMRARAHFDAAAARLARAFPATNTNRGVLVRPLRAEIDEQTERDSVWILFGIVGCVLLIACTNVANLMLGRAASRQKEIAVRLAIGAGRVRLMRQLLTENLLLFLIGGVLGVFVAVSGVSWLGALIPDEVRGFLPNYGVLRVDLPVLLYTFTIAVLTGLVFGLTPAFHCLRLSVGASIARSSLKKALVVFELSLALVVLATAGLLIKSMVRIYSVNPGFDPHDLVTAKIALPASQYPEHARVEAFYSALLQRIRLSPAVLTAGASQYIPFCGFDADAPYFIEGRPLPPPGEGRGAMTTTVTPGYLSALGVPLIRGRFFSDRDRAESAPVILINRAMAQREWLGEDPIGGAIRLGNSSGTLRFVIGIVGNVKIENLKEPVFSQLYLPFPQSPALSMYVVVRTRGTSAEVAAAIRSAAAAVDKNQPVYDIAAMEKRIAVEHAPNVIVTQAVTLFAVIALFLAAIGIYGVISYSVAARRREIGVRMALGARTGDVLALVLGQGLRLSALGIASGLLGSIGMSGLLRTLLFQVSPTDLGTLAVVSLLLGAVAVLACYLPARRAARIDPAVILRSQ